MKELKRLLPYIKKYRKRIFIGLLFVTISNICSTYVPRVVGGTIDTLKRGNFQFSDIYTSIAYILLLTAGSGLFMFLTRQTIIVASRLIEYDLRQNFTKAAESQSSSFFHTNTTGSLMALVTNDISAAREFLGPAIMYAANTVTTFSFALYFMLSLDPLLTLISLLPIPIIAVTTYRMGKKMHIASKKIQDQFSSLTTQAQETFSGIKVVKSYNREEFESSNFKNLSSDYLHKNMKLAKIQAVMMPSLMVLIGLSQIMMLGYGGYQILNGRATYGTITQFFIYINLLIWPVIAIGWVTNLVQRAAASTGRLGKIFDSVPDIKEDENTDNSLTVLSGDIVFDDIKLHYNGSSNGAINGINLEIKEGESLGIVGMVGSGKSSFVNLLPRLYDATGGRILIGGRDIREYPLNVLRNSIAAVPQDPFLFSLTIEENIKFGKADATKDDILKASEIACLNEDIELFPDGYKTMLGERGITLSGGQKQRLAIARAVIRQPKILILDDALSSVDTGTEDKILRNLKEFMKGRTTIIISHRVNTVKECDRIITIGAGKIAESGTHEELSRGEGFYSMIYERQQLESEIEQL